MTAWVLKSNIREGYYFGGIRRDGSEIGVTDISQAVHFHSEADAIMNRDALVNGAQNYTPLEVQN